MKNFELNLLGIISSDKLEKSHEKNYQIYFNFRPKSKTDKIQCDDSLQNDEKVGQNSNLIPLHTLHEYFEKIPKNATIFFCSANVPISKYFVTSIGQNINATIFEKISKFDQKNKNWIF